MSVIGSDVWREIMYIPVNLQDSNIINVHNSGVKYGDGGVL